MKRLLISFAVLVLSYSSVHAADFGVGVRPLDNTLLFPIRFNDKYLLELSFSYSQASGLASSSDEGNIYKDDADKKRYGAGFSWLQSERYNFQPYFGVRFSYISGYRQKENDPRFTTDKDFKISTHGLSVSPIVVGFTYNVNRKFSLGIESGFRISKANISRKYDSAGSILNDRFNGKESYSSENITMKTFTNLVVRFLF